MPVKDVRNCQICHLRVGGVELRRSWRGRIKEKLVINVGETEKEV